MPTDVGPGPDGQLLMNRAHFNGTTPPMNDGAGAQGYVYEGLPPTGDYVAASDAGMSYVSPGYR
jgi:hypothetical protein